MNDFLDMFGAYNYLVRDSLILVLLGFSVYIMLNAGLFAVPQVGFMAVGAYAAAILATRYDAPLWVTLPAGCIVGALVGLLLGTALARLDGVYRRSRRSPSRRWCGTSRNLVLPASHRSRRDTSFALRPSHRRDPRPRHRCSRETRPHQDRLGIRGDP